MPTTNEDTKENLNYTVFISWPRIENVKMMNQFQVQE